MSKKKGKGAEEPPKLLGRPGNHVKIGIVGMPNVGKSTLFNLLTKMEIPAENYPFCTIDPNEARVEVPDSRHDWLVDHWKPASSVKAFLSVVDIAGLVKGASEGEGLGNAFLSHINAVDAIYHVVRIFDSEEITHVEGSIDPIRDILTIENELRLKDIEKIKKVEKSLELVCRRNNKNDRTKAEELETVRKALGLLESGQNIRFEAWSSKEIDVLNEILLLSAKPVTYLVNLSERDFAKKRNKWLGKLAEWAAERPKKETMIPISCAFEKRLNKIKDLEKRAQVCKQYKVSSTIPKIIKKGYASLNLIHFFTCGKDEVKCWTIRKFTKAPQAAGTIHTDFMVGFICAEVMKFTDYKELGSELAVKQAGKHVQQGKNYVVNDGDIIFFKANTGGGLKKKK